MKTGYKPHFNEQHAFLLQKETMNKERLAAWGDRREEFSAFALTSDIKLTQIKWLAKILEECLFACLFIRGFQSLHAWIK